MWYTGPVKGGGMVSKLTKRALAASLKKLLAQKLSLIHISEPTRP